MNYVDNPFESPVVLSICTGTRGLERGVERALGKPLRVAAYVEIEAFIIENLLAGMEAGLVDAAPVWANLKTFPAQPFRNKLHGIIGGYPCQPFSVAGKQKGTSDPRHLFPFIERIIQTTRPVWCFFENVDDHLSIGFDTVYKSLADLGYAVEAGIFSAAEVGAPHERQRLFILALANSYCDEFARRFAKIKRTPATNEIKAWFEDGEWLWNEPVNSRKELVNSKGICQREQANATDAFTTSGQTWNEPGNGGEFMGNTISQGLEIGQKQSAWQKQQTTERASLWPAGQGFYQHEWEEPRTIEPRLGCTVNGYNFKEDLLRALGNGVVEQTAEIAFKELTKKHFHATTRNTGRDFKNPEA